MPLFITNGKKRCHSILCLRSNKDNIENPHPYVDLSIRIFRRKPIVEYLLKIIRVIFADELGQFSAEEITVYDYILRQVRGSTSFMCGILMIVTLDYLQIQLIDGKRFLFAHSMIPCIIMVS